MKLNAASRPFAFALIVLGAICAIGVMTFASACVHDDGSVSVCHTAQIAVCAGGIAVLALGAASLFAGKKAVAAALFFIMCACGVFVAAAPGTLFALCMMDTMRCHLIMQPFSQVVGAVIAVVSLIGAIRSLRVK